ncbi:metal-dependent hydrolase [Cohnella pontilimi]|uniref:Metal-dependent hydrolase n=1 Tax=Cohnella pontilimi TaxID=2564100 RepID=A0A4U0FGF2_9BACL|nr:metal-dependent hydrolase [Cohnella pontilimi]TJY42452.1 metal-dependent hydrolase [Cohnella pontilimi]
MKGSTHLAIGGAIGMAAAIYFPFQLDNAAIYLSVAAFSALAPDLDGSNLLSGKLSKLSRWLRDFGLWIGLLLVIGNAYLYFSLERFYPIFAAISVIILLFGLVTSQGIIRNGLVSLIGIGLLYAGMQMTQTWLLELGVFVTWVPWLNHRGMTHTVWAIFLWGVIGWELEKQLNIEGIVATSVAGYASHLLADTLTPSGVKWLYPIYQRSFKIIPR